MSATRLLSELVGACVVRLLAADGVTFEPVYGCVDRNDPELLNGLREIVQQTQLRVGHRPIGRVASTGTTVTIDKLEHAENMLESGALAFLSRFNIARILGAPLKARSKTIRVIALCRRKTGRSFSLDEERWVEDLADRAALAIENTRLVSGLERRVVELERAEEKVRALIEAAPDRMTGTWSRCLASPFELEPDLDGLLTSGFDGCVVLGSPVSGSCRRSTAAIEIG